MKHIQLFESFLNERADYKYKKSSKYPVKAAVCYIDQVMGKRICKDLYFVYENVVDVYFNNDLYD